MIIDQLTKATTMLISVEVTLSSILANGYYTLSWRECLITVRTLQRTWDLLQMHDGSVFAGS